MKRFLSLVCALLLSAQFGNAATVANLVSGGPLTVGDLTFSNFSYRNISSPSSVQIDAGSIDVTTRLVTTDPSAPGLFGRLNSYVEFVFDFNDVELSRQNDTRFWRNALDFDVTAGSGKSIELVGISTIPNRNYGVSNGFWQAYINLNGSIDTDLGRSIVNTGGLLAFGGSRSIDPTSSTNIGWLAVSSLDNVPTARSTFAGFEYRVYFGDPLPPADDPDPVDPIDPPSIVPLPGAMPLMLVGIAGLTVLRRKRAHANPIITAK